jgi:predicted Fe-S protein YdhL (DUF1289 family)
MKTPCILVCRINPQTRMCEGCYRTMEEIREWLRFTEEEREEIMKKVRQRVDSNS